jgi:hypothetical protein
VTPGHQTLDANGRFRPISEILAEDARVVLADGSVIGISHERVVYSADTAHLYEQAERVVTPTAGGLALAPRIELGWKTYNFEVERLHTYVAGGVRVHNDSGIFGEVGNAVDKFLNKFGVVGDVIGDVISAGLHIVGEVVDTVQSLVGSMVQGFFNFMSGLGSAITGTLRPEPVVQAPAVGMPGGDGDSPPGGGAGGLLGGIVEAIKDVINSVVETVSSLAVLSFSTSTRTGRSSWSRLANRQRSSTMMATAHGRRPAGSKAMMACSSWT